ncbi:MAG: amidase family protein, partial [Planctomycetota bacterium]
MNVTSTATELLSELNSGAKTSVEVCQSYLNQIKTHNETIGAFLSYNEEQALAHAKDVDERRAAGKPVGLLGGLPVAIKDLLCTKGQPTTCASKMLENYAPPYDATVVERLRAADAVVIGKTNLDEFAMGGSTENSGLGKTCNPWDTSRVPGGSSGGAAAAVASGMAPLSLGTDTGGSIRQPAAFCNVVGLKPTYGRVSRYGLIAFASSLDQIGPLARTVEDTALLLEAIAGADSRDATCAPVEVPAYSKSVTQPLEGLKLGVVKEHFGEGLDSEVESAVKEAIDVYRKMGAEIVDISLPHSRYGIATYYIIAPSEASSNLARYDGAHYGYRTNEDDMKAELAEQRAEARKSDSPDTALAKLDSPLVRMYRRSRSESLGDEVKRRIMLGTYALSAGYYDAYYLKALKVRRLIRQDYDQAFEKVDFVVGPVTPTPAFKIGELSDDPL